MKQKVNDKYIDLFTTNQRYYILMGGRAAGRSYVASQYALAKLLANGYFRCAIMRFILSDIRNSIYQEIIDRAEEQEIKDILKIKDHLLSIECGANKINGIGFRKSSADQKSKLKSLASYNCIIIEEADEVDEEDFMQLDDSIRTIKSDIKIILLLNPPSKRHWIIKRWFNLDKAKKVDGFYIPTLKESCKKDTCFFYTNYKDNLVNLHQKTIDNFQRYKTINPEHYWNMIIGYISEGNRGRIFKDWKRITNKEFEELPYISTYGLDFGFSNDPAALIEIKEHNEKIWCRELLYEVGLTNVGNKGNSLSERFESLGLSKDDEIYADSAEPKSIEELKSDGWNVIPTIKGSDSIRAGIDLLLSKEVYFTEESVNIDIEVQEYVWALDKDKNPTNKPIDAYNHAIDAIRGNILTRNNKPYIGFA